MHFKIIPFFTLLLLICTITPNSLTAQVVKKTQRINPTDTIAMSNEERRFKEKYNKNIKKTRINGVYIPKDMEDAFSEIEQLAKRESLEKFKSADAEFVVKRLHYSLGRWMILNWNFYEGSRISHHVKSYGVSHPDDQARFILLALHNHLNKKDLELSAIAKHISNERQAIIDERKSSFKKGQ